MTGQPQKFRFDSDTIQIQIRNQKKKHQTQDFKGQPQEFGGRPLETQESCRTSDEIHSILKGNPRNSQEIHRISQETRGNSKGNHRTYRKAMRFLHVGKGGEVSTQNVWRRVVHVGHGGEFGGHHSNHRKAMGLQTKTTGLQRNKHRVIYRHSQCCQEKCAI